MSKDGLPRKEDLKLVQGQRAANRTDVLPGLPGNDDAGIAVADVPAWDESPTRGRRHAEGTGHYDCAGVVAICGKRLQFEHIWLRKNY